ncbi:MAG: Do family serine endopeptidase [Burkholderiales bacterium]|nr:Do family serine endopeptidase [Burkholderiales bacterium]
MLRHLWLIFAQTATVCLAVWFVIATLKPEWLAGGNGGVAPPAPVAPVPAPAGAGAPPPPAETGAADAPRYASYSDAARRAMPAVVNIFTSKEVKLPQHPFMNDPLFRHFFGGDARGKAEPRRSNSLGSGVIVSAQGYVLTNFHVIESADEVEVLLSDNRRAQAKIVGGDPETDLAVVKIELPDIPYIVFGQPEAARVGDVVLAIGNPYGVGQTVTQGIISATGRSQLGISTFENFLQTDAAINPGNSGGALVDTRGRLLGINTAIYSRSGASAGIGFAIPANMARQVMDQIIATGTVTRGFIGIEPQEITAELAESFKLPRDQGVLIAGVIRNGPADKAGIRPGDVLVEVEGTPVRDASQMLNLIAQLTPGNAARLRVVRQGQSQEIAVTIGKRPRPQRRARDSAE